MKLVVASNNPGKLREFDALLKPLGWEAVTQKTLGVAECAEPHATFVENALRKSAPRGVAQVCPPWRTIPVYACTL